MYMRNERDKRSGTETLKRHQGADQEGKRMRERKRDEEEEEKDIPEK
jgi:hypothetical protein